MKIGTKYQIISDSMNVTLQKQGYNKKREEHYWSNIAYFSSPKNALAYMVEQEISGTGFDDLETVVKKIDELHKIISGLKPDLLPELVQSKSDVL